ncbi:Hypothetical protein LBF_3195 [Leptospira biflexa serovar Patoc strain 'Patoc 1 (Ames)']|nr:zinc-ribbon domain-containing transport protein [Leptospira biflexa]ABZ95664.1 Hypothetical protein LBF_3195 [Leptospira biflexa serovar Patoc strain 'Patoc 1 (Ames)']
MLKIVFILSLFVVSITSIGARPGMGNSYRSSSSSSSSSSRSSYSSYKPSASSSSTSKSSSATSSYSTRSAPEPTSYFESTNHQILVQFFADGSAEVKENFRIKKDQSKIGIRRSSFLIHRESEISDLRVSPDSLLSSHNSGIITIFWPNSDPNPEMDISLNYRIQEAYFRLGGLSLINWRFSKTSHSSTPFVLDLQWEPNSFSNEFRIQEEIFNSSFSEYERKDIPVPTSEKQFQYHQSGNVESNGLVITDVLNWEKEANQISKNNSSSESPNHTYTLHQTVTLKDNGVHFYQSKIQISKENPNLDSLQIQLGLQQFREFGESFWNQIWTPAYQISYAFEGVSTYFWHLFNVTLSDGIDQPNNQRIYEFAFKTMGEVSNRMEQGIERWVRITSLEKRDQLLLQRFALRVLSESKMDPSQTKMEIIVKDCDFCSDTLDNSSLIIPIQPKWEEDGFFLEWSHPIPPNYTLYLRMTETNKHITYNPILIYYAVLSAFLHSPGSGNHLGHLTVIGLISFCLLVTGFISFNRKQTKKSEKQVFQSILSKIQNEDPSFDFKQFKEKVIFITETTVSAWDKGNMEPARNFISAAVFQRFSIQLHLMNSIDGEVNRMKDFQVVSVQIIGSEIESEYFTLHLKLKCKTKDKTFPKQTSELEIQNQLNHVSSITYEEIHSYTRKLGTKTKPKIDLMHKLCPSCGASPKFSHTTNRCEYCGGIFNSGEADWVLTEITQTVEWESVKDPKVKSLPIGIAKQLLEDRASSVFWKYLHFLSIPNSQILHRESLETSYDQLGRPGNEPMHSPVVGSCHLIEYKHDSNPHQMTCEIRWSVARKKGLVPEHRRSRITFVLPSERPKSLGFSEVSCSNCGAPLPEIDANNCSYCQKPIPEKVSDWLFASINKISL